MARKLIIFSQINPNPVKFFKLDLALEEKRLKEVFKEENFSAVIHFAGHKAVGESVAQPLEYYENNLASTLNLLKAMKEVFFGVNRLKKYFLIERDGMNLRTTNCFSDILSCSCLFFFCYRLPALQRAVGRV